MAGANSAQLLAAPPVAPLSQHSLLVFLLQVTLLLALALGLGQLALRFGMPSVIGELLAGVMAGPSLLGAAAPDLTRWLLPADPGQMHLLDAVGQLGVILLVGFTGMEIDARMVRRRGATAARISVAGLLLPLGLGIGAGLLLPKSLLADHAHRPVFVLFLGVAMAISAIPVAAKILLDMRLLHRNVGQLIMAAATVDDAVGWLLLSVAAGMATSGVRVHEIAWSVVSVVGVVVLAYVAGRPLVRWIIRFGGLAGPTVGAAGENAAGAGDGSTVARHASPGPGPGIVVATVVVLACAAGTHALRLEPILGAFFGGILIGSTPTFDPRRLEPLRQVVLGVLAPVFFASAGLRVNLTALARPEVALTSVVVLALALLGKFGGAYAGARASRLGHWEALSLGAGLNARGVIEIVVAGTGLRLGVLSTAMYTVIVLVAIVTSVMTPPVLRATMRRVEQTTDEKLRASTSPVGSVPVRSSS